MSAGESGTWFNVQFKSNSAKPDSMAAFSLQLGLIPTMVMPKFVLLNRRIYIGISL